MNENNQCLEKNFSINSFLNKNPEYKDRFIIIKKKEVNNLDMSNWTKGSGNFLKPDDIKKTPAGVFIIRDEGTFTKSEKFGTEQFHIMGEFATEEKIFNASKTNCRTIEKALGTDSKKWIGHSLSFELYKTKTSDGKLVDALNVKEVK